MFFSRRRSALCLMATVAAVSTGCAGSDISVESSEGFGSARNPAPNDPQMADMPAELLQRFFTYLPFNERVTFGQVGKPYREAFTDILQRRSAESLPLLRPLPEEKTLQILRYIAETPKTPLFYQPLAITLTRGVLS